jgi:hypothetical protein
MELNRRTFLKKLGIGTVGVVAISTGLPVLPAVAEKAPLFVAPDDKVYKELTESGGKWDMVSAVHATTKTK